MLCLQKTIPAERNKPYNTMHLQIKESIKANKFFSLPLNACYVSYLIVGHQALITYHLRL